MRLRFLYHILTYTKSRVQITFNSAADSLQRMKIFTNKSSGKLEAKEKQTKLLHALASYRLVFSNTIGSWPDKGWRSLRHSDPQLHAVPLLCFPFTEEFTDDEDNDSKHKRQLCQKYLSKKKDQDGELRNMEWQHNLQIKSHGACESKSTFRCDKALTLMLRT